MNRHGKSPELDQQKHNLLVKLARMYYLQKMTHKEIADQLGLSRIKITRLLSEAIDRSIVSFQIVDPYMKTLELESALCAAFNLKQAVITPSAPDESQLLDTLGKYAAGFISARLVNHMNIGIGWGRTLNAMAPWFPAGSASGITVVSLTGGLAPNPRQPSPYDITTTIARTLEATPRYLLAPAIIDKVEEKDILLHNESNMAVAELWHHLDMAIFSIGTISPPAQMLGFFADPVQEARKLHAQGAVGDLLMSFFDETGAFIETDFSRRTICIDFALLKNVPLVIGVSGGPTKIKPILGALRTGLLNVLVTDEASARQLINLAEK